MVEHPIERIRDRKSTRLNSSHLVISYAVFCLKKKTRFPLLGQPAGLQQNTRTRPDNGAARRECLVGPGAPHAVTPGTPCPTISFFFFFKGGRPPHSPPPPPPPPPRP